MIFCVSYIKSTTRTTKIMVHRFWFQPFRFFETLNLGCPLKLGGHLNLGGPLNLEGPCNLGGPLNLVGPLTWALF